MLAASVEEGMGRDAANRVAGFEMATDVTRRDARWKWIAAALTLATLILTGVLFATTRPQSNGAAALYNAWTLRMASLLDRTPGPVDRVVFAQQFYAPIAWARGMTLGYSLAHPQAPHDVQLFASYLAGINDYLGRLMEGYWTDSRTQRPRDVQRIRRLVRDVLFRRLATQERGGFRHFPVELHTDSDATGLDRTLCGIAADMKRAWYRAYVVGGLPSADNAQLRLACAHGETFP